jgi:hypothetical protein
MKHRRTGKTAYIERPLRAILSGPRRSFYHRRHLKGYRPFSALLWHYSTNIGAISAPPSADAYHDQRHAQERGCLAGCGSLFLEGWPSCFWCRRVAGIPNPLELRAPYCNPSLGYGYGAFVIATTWGWLINPSNDPVISAIGFLLGVVGFAITLGGFAVAYRRLVKLEAASEAARVAVENFKLRVTYYDALRDVAGAQYALETARRHLDNPGWRHVYNCFEDARKSIVHVVPSISDDDLLYKELQLLVDIQAKACTKIDKHLIDPSRSAPDISGLRSSIRSQLDVMIKVQHHLGQRAA